MGSESFAANYANYANRRVKDSIDAPVRVVRVIRGKILVAAYAALNFALLQSCRDGGTSFRGPDSLLHK